MVFNLVVDDDDDDDDDDDNDDDDDDDVFNFGWSSRDLFSSIARNSLSNSMYLLSFDVDCSILLLMMMMILIMMMML